jgi:hypothetical protein
MLFGSTKYWFSWTGRPKMAWRLCAIISSCPHLIPSALLLLLLMQGKAEVPCTCSILVRRAVTEEIVVFEESFRGMNEDQAFYAKICLYAPVLATDDCLAWYRQHSKSNYSTAIHSGQARVYRYRFLSWLKHLSRKTGTDKRVWGGRRQLWLCSNSHQRFPDGRRYPLIKMDTQSGRTDSALDLARSAMDTQIDVY